MLMIIITLNLFTNYNKYYISLFNLRYSIMISNPSDSVKQYLLVNVDNNFEGNSRDRSDLKNFGYFGVQSW